MHRWLSKWALYYSDLRSNTQNSFSFYKSFASSGKAGFIKSILILLFIIVLDFSLRKLYHYWQSFPNTSLFHRITTYISAANNFIGVKNIDRFADTISIGAGVLGVLLGLFYTAFLTIISTKYSKINSIIRSQLLQQKTLNNYLALLATVTSVSFLFQFLLSLGYRPTIVSCILFSFLVVISLTSFSNYGRYSLIFYDSSYLVYDLLHSSKKLLLRISRHRKNIEYLKKESDFLNIINFNIYKIDLIVDESKRTDISDTSLNKISEALLDFLLYYNSIKHIIPSKKGWHLVSTNHKRWEEIGAGGYDLFKSTGVALLTENIDKYNLIEQNIISIQFEIFNYYIKDSGSLQLLLEQNKALQVISIQNDEELTVHFFRELEKLFILKLEKIDKTDLKFRLSIPAIYSALQISYLVGLNNNIKIFTAENIVKLAKAIHNNSNTDKFFQFPYYLKVWMDNYQIFLENEALLEEKKITSLFHTQFEISNEICYNLKKHLQFLIEYFLNNIERLTKKMKDEKCELEALQLNLDSLELIKKFEYSLSLITNKIEDLNHFNYYTSSHFKTEDFEKLKAFKNKHKKKIINAIWEVGLSSTELSKDLPDLFGSYYLLILEDLANELLHENISFNNIKYKYIKFCQSAMLYILNLQDRYKNVENTEYTPSLIFPIIKDIFDIGGILIIVAKTQDNDELINMCFDFWNSHFTSEKKYSPQKEFNFWEYLYSIFNYFEKSLYMGIGYEREFSRARSLENYMISKKYVRKEPVNHQGLSFIEHYVTDIDDIYIKALASEMSIDGLDLIKIREIWIEFYLRGRISLKELKIKETYYGERIIRIMERKEE